MALYTASWRVARVLRHVATSSSSPREKSSVVIH
jgi:hypothetical protein